MSLRRHGLSLLVIATLALGAFAPSALAADPTPTPVATPTPAPSDIPPVASDCSTTSPEFEYTIDLAASAPLSPMVQFRENGMALPAAGRFFWGDGQYGVANLNQVGGGTEFFKQVQPVYAKPGSYTFSSQLTDRCGKLFTIDYPIAVPITLPGTLTLECPGTTDVSGFCLVPLNKPIVFTVGGGPDKGWRWDADGPEQGRTLTRTFSTIGEFWIQARSISKDGMIVSPILKVAPRAPSKPRITEVHIPDQVNEDEVFSASFVIPAGAEDAKPSIYVDGQKVSDSTSTETSLKAGTHVVTFVLTWPDDTAVSRQAGVISIAPPPPPPPEGPNPLLVLGAILGGGLLLAFLLLFLLLLWRWRKRRRANKLLAAESRWLRAILLDEGWTIEGPTRVMATEDEPAQSILLAEHGPIHFRITRPQPEEKWLWQDLLYSIAAELGGEPLSEKDPEISGDLDEM